MPEKVGDMREENWVKVNKRIINAVTHSTKAVVWNLPRLVRYLCLSFDRWIILTSSWLLCIRWPNLKECWTQYAQSIYSRETYASIVSILVLDSSAADNINNRWQESMPKFKMVAVNRKYIYNAYIYGCVPDSNNISTATPMFSRSCHTIRQLRILSDGRIRDK
jgi:hypothetical protein